MYLHGAHSGYLHSQLHYFVGHEASGYIHRSDHLQLCQHFRDFPAAPGVYAGAQRSGGGGQDRWRKPLEDPVESSMPDHKIVIYHLWSDEFYQLLQQLHVAIPDHGLRFQDDGIPGTSEIFH